MTTDFFKPLRRRPRKPGRMSPRRSAAGIAAALIVALGGAAVFVGSPANAATMTAAATAHAAPKVTTSGGTVPGAKASGGTAAAHVCEVLGHDNTNQAVVCADLVVTSLGGGAYAVNGRAEAICEGLSNKSSFPQCANADVWIAIEDASIGDAALGECGHRAGPCSTPRTYFSGPSWDVGNGQCLRDVWATIFYYLPSTNTAIELPGSGAEEFMDANLSTPHFNIGNGC